MSDFDRLQSRSFQPRSFPSNQGQQPFLSPSTILPSNVPSFLPSAQNPPFSHISPPQPISQPFSPFSAPPQPQHSNFQNKALLDTLKCSICLDTVIEPMQPNCLNNCNALVCKQHTPKLYNCPSCKKHANWRVDRTAQNLLSVMSEMCQCRQVVSLAQVASHKIVCPFGQRTCPACGFQGQNREILDHVYKKHYHSLIENFEKCLR